MVNRVLKDLHSQHAQELIKLSNRLDNLNLIGNVYDDDIVSNTLDDDNKMKQREELLRKQNNTFQRKLIEFYNDATNQMFQRLEQRSKGQARGNICGNPMVPSSRKGIVTLAHSKSRRINKTIWEIAGLNNSNDKLSNIFFDEYNESCFSVPLEDIVCEHTDRKIIVYAGNHKLKVNEQRDGKVYAYEFGWAYNLHQESNNQIKKAVSTYLNNAFVNEHDQIEDILKRSSTKVLMIINRESTLSNKITATNIVSLIVFGNDDLVGTCIDYIATVLDYTGMSFAPFLIHNAQVFGCREITRKTDNSVQKNFTCVLMCKSSLSFYYKRLGFFENEIETYLNDVKFQGASDRLHLKEWCDGTRPKGNYNIMRINEICPRFVNHISYFPSSFERSLYAEDDDDSVSQWSNLSLMTKLNACFTSELQQLVNDRKFYKHTYHYDDMYNNCKNNETTFFHKLYHMAMKIPIGKIYRAAIANTTAQMETEENYENISSALIDEALDPLTVVFYFKDITSETYDNAECWINVRCSCCKKNVYVRKQSTDFFNVFMNKIVMSVWFVHILGLENVPDNQWYSCNDKWNICSARRGSLYNKLKNGLHLDSIQDDVNNDKTIATRNIQNLDGLWEKIYSEYPDYYKVVAMMSYLIHKKITSNISQRDTSSTYVERSQQLLNEIAPPSKKTVEEQAKDQQRKEEQLKRYKRKREAGYKKDLKKAEFDWIDTYLEDIALQKEFKDIEYVDVATCKAFDPASQVYLDELKEEQQRSRRRKENRALSVPDQNHFLMYDRSKKRAHVVDEDWLVYEDPVDNTPVYMVTKATIDKCMATPNRKYALSSTDKRNIKNHVEDITIGRQIVRIKRVQESANEQAEETVNFRGHNITSKLAFVGYDIRNRFHPISTDWVRMNYKTQQPNTFKILMNLKPGQTHKLESGSSTGHDQTIIEMAIKNGTITPIGPKLTYVQYDSPSCLPRSLASALAFLDRNVLAKRIMRNYREFVAENKSKAFDMNEVLQLTKHNRGRLPGERRFRFDVKKITVTNTIELLKKSETNCFYHCVLMNNHAVVIIDKWIFDPTLQNALPRNEQHLRYSAQSEPLEDINNVIFLCYQYSWNNDNF